MYGQRLKELRQEKELSQQKLAIELQTSQKNISKYETEYLDLSTDMIIKICKYFDISADYLLGLEDETGAKINAPKYHIGTLNNNGGTVDLK